jgi:hypothetical protein
VNSILGSPVKEFYLATKHWSLYQFGQIEQTVIFLLAIYQHTSGRSSPETLNRLPQRRELSSSWQRSESSLLEIEVNDPSATHPSYMVTLRINTYFLRSAI